MLDNRIRALSPCQLRDPARGSFIVRARYTEGGDYFTAPTVPTGKTEWIASPNAIRFRQKRDTHGNVR